MNESLGAICMQQLRACRHVILMGPVGLRSLELPGIRDLVRNGTLHLNTVRSCCLGVRGKDGEHRQIATLTSFHFALNCSCGASEHEAKAITSVSGAAARHIYSLCLMELIDRCNQGPVKAVCGVPFMKDNQSKTNQSLSELYARMLTTQCVCTAVL